MFNSHAILFQGKEHDLRMLERNFRRHVLLLKSCLQSNYHTTYMTKKRVKI